MFGAYMALTRNHSAAAMQALKMFSGGHGGSSGGMSGGSSGGGQSQNQFVGMAMSQAAKLFGSSP